MDITIDVNDYKLNVRAACVIKHNNKIFFLNILPWIRIIHHSLKLVDSLLLFTSK